MMKKTILLFIAFLSTTVLFAQNKDLATKQKSQALPQLETVSSLGSIEMSDYKKNTSNAVQKSSQENDVTVMDDSNAEYELAMKKQVQANEAKSKIAKEKRDQQSEAIALRLQNAEQSKSALKTSNSNSEKQRMELEQKRAAAKQKALQNYVAPSSKELIEKKSNK